MWKDFPFDASKVEIGKKIPVEDDSAFTLIAEASKYLVKYSLTPDKLVYANEQSVVLYFGSVEVLIGNKEYEIRIAQIKPILEKLKEQYPDQAGVLHLENYEADQHQLTLHRSLEAELLEKTKNKKKLLIIYGKDFIIYLLNCIVQLK